MNEMFHKQITFQARLNYTSLIGNQSFINIQSLALIDEIMEALRETPWKPWKKQQLFNKEKYKEELIDCWHFLINLSLASGMNAEEVKERFMKKNKENNERQKNNY